MAWDDVLFGVLTGGLYNVGKAAYKAGEAAEDAGEAAEQAGVSLAIIGSTVESVGKQLVSLLAETEELITINRLTPRHESDLWEEEKKRLDDLKILKAKLENDLSSLGVSEPSGFSFNFGDFFNNLSEMVEKLQLIGKLVAVNNEIHEILYQEPGVISNGIYNANEVLERFNTIEQPKIEDILDSLDDNLEVTEETIREIKKLFVTKNKIPVLESALTKEQKGRLDILEIDDRYLRNLIGRKNIVSSQLIGVMEKMPAREFEITDKTIKVAGVDSGLFGHVKSTIEKTTGNVSDVRNASKKVIEESGASREKISRDIKIDKSFDSRVNISGSKARIEKRDIKALSGISLALATRPKYSITGIQPQGAKISAALNTKFDGYQRNYAFSKAQLAFYDREILKNARRIDKIKFKWEDEPGVIPKTLDEIKEILERVKKEEQPRIEKVLDTLNGNLEESKEALSRVNDSLESTQGALSFVNKHSGTIKIAAGIFAGVIVLDLVLVFFVLLRMALGL